MNKTETIAGVDIGGTHITAALVDLNENAIIPNSSYRKLINPNGSAEEIIYEWSVVIKNVFKNYNSDKKIGIAMPGPFDYAAGISLIKNQNKYDALYGMNIKKMLSESLQMQHTNICLMNDAACFLQGEVFGGAAKGFKKAMGLTLGTGLGSAKFYKGKSGDANLWQSKFLNGIAEDYLSTRWFVNRFLEITGITISGVKQLVELTTNTQIVNKLFEEFGRNLAQFLKDFILTEKPEVIVIGGNIAHAYHLFSSSLHNNLQQFSHDFILKKAVLGENGNLIGAASSWVKKMEPVI